jgi:hypothetical protein
MISEPTYLLVIYHLTLKLFNHARLGNAYILLLVKQKCEKKRILTIIMNHAARIQLQTMCFSTQ